MAQMVSDSIRNANSRAIARRDQWRRKYAALSRLIRDNKRILAVMPSYDMQMNLIALRRMADSMMLARWEIAMDLRDTAYEYADHEHETQMVA